MKGLDYLNRAVWHSCGTSWKRTSARPSLKLQEVSPRICKSATRFGTRWDTSLFIWRRTRRNLAYPFAFLVTYTHRVSERGKVQHLPLGRALEEHAGAKNRAELAALLSPVQRAAEQSKLACELLDVTPRASPDYAGNVAGSLVGSPGFWSNTTSGPSTLAGVKSQN